MIPSSPVLILLYGFPGSGKTYFSRQLCNEVQFAHMEEDRIRTELFEKPRHTKQENFAVNRIMQYMAGEFLNSGVSVIYDTNAMHKAQRRSLKELATRHKASVFTVWFQIDPETAFARSSKRDKRKLDDRYSMVFTPEQFREIASHMQHPEQNEAHIVVSGKHAFRSQLSSVIKKMADLGLVKQTQALSKMIKPELVNLVASHKTENKPKTAGSHTIVLR